MKKKAEMIEKTLAGESFGKSDEPKIKLSGESVQAAKTQREATSIDKIIVITQPIWVKKIKILFII